MGNYNGKGRKLLMKQELKDKFRRFKEYSRRTDWYSNEMRMAFSSVSEINHRIPYFNSDCIHWSDLYSLLTLPIFELVFIFRLRYINLCVQHRCLHIMVLFTCVITDIWCHFTCARLSGTSNCDRYIADFIG